mmetsp:Transcript_147564/g.471978  ORF Transcript_147564/g.471978 Transcript_147564/m.471978 type:complete len:107 (+) Transcript_147564:1317-1637(+)
MENCEQLCNGRPAEEEAACMAECQASTIERQPAAVRTYMEVLFCIVVPFFQLLAAALTYTFPIKGERLEAIYRGQADHFQVTAAVVGLTAAPEGRDDVVVLESARG